MNRFLTLPRLATLFGVLFVVGVLGVFAYQRIWVDPANRCEKEGGWYSHEMRECGRVIYLPNITGRPEGMSRAEASDLGNRELLELETEAARQEAALRAEVARQRAAVER